MLRAARSSANASKKPSPSPAGCPSPTRTPPPRSWLKISYLVVSYNLDRQVQGEYTNYQVTMVIKSKKSYDEGYLLQLMQEFPEVTVEKIE